MKRLTLHLLLLALAGLSVLPLAWMVTTSLQLDLPGRSPWSLSHYHRLLENWPYLRWLSNSLFLSGTQTLISTLLSAMGGFALAKYSFTGKRAIMAMMALVMLLPSQVLLPSTFELMARFGWVNSYLAILAPGAVSVFGLFLFQQAMSRVPNELLSAARIDGCSELMIWWQIALPVVRPTIGAFSLMSFLASWNSYLWPSIVLQSDYKLTLPIGLTNLAAIAETRGGPGLLMAATTLSILPVAGVFILLQREFISGITAGAVKE